VALEEQNGETVAGEAGGLFGRAGADGGSASLDVIEAGSEIFRQFGEVGGFEAIVGAGLAGMAAIGHAGFASVFATGRGFEAAGLKKHGDTALLFVNRESFDGAGKILRGKQIAASMHRGDADRGEVGIENVAAMAGRVHPAHVDDLSIFGDGNVLGNQRKVSSGISNAIAQGCFAGVLMLEKLFLSHAQGMLASSFGERGIPFQRGQVLLGAFAICGFKEFFFSAGRQCHAGRGARRTILGCDITRIEKCACETKSQSKRPAECLHGWLAAHVHGAEAQNDVAAGSGTAEAEHGTEAREEQHLIEFAAEVGALRTGKNLVVDHLPLRIDGDVEKQAMRQSQLSGVLLGSPGGGIFGERNEFGWAHQVDRHIVFNGANRDAWRDHLKSEDEDESRRQESTGSRDGERAKYVVEQNLTTITQFAIAAGPSWRRLRLSNGDLDSNRKIGGWGGLWNAGKQHRHFAEALQLGAARSAGFEMLSDAHTLLNASGTNESVVEIAGQFCTNGRALHGSPSPAELVRRDLFSATRSGEARAGVAAPCGEVLLCETAA